MFATLAYILTLIAPAPLATVDPCAIILADGPNLDGLAAEMADECTRERASHELADGRVEAAPLGMAREEWAFAEPRTPVDLDAELATIGPRVNPFASDDGAGPFADVVTRCEPICRR
jgi:hypothetical protein